MDWFFKLVGWLTDVDIFFDRLRAVPEIYSKHGIKGCLLVILFFIALFAIIAVVAYSSGGGTP